MKELKKNSPIILYLSLASPCICLLSKLSVKFLQSLSEHLHVISYHPFLGPSPLFQLYLFLFKVTGTEHIISGGDITVRFPPIHFAASRSCLLFGF